MKKILFFVFCLFASSVFSETKIDAMRPLAPVKSWTPYGNAGFSADQSGGLVITSAGIPYALTMGKKSINVMTLQDEKWVLVGQSILMTTSNSSIALNKQNDTPYLAILGSTSDSPLELRIMKLDKGQWVSVGERPIFSVSDFPDQPPQLAFNQKGVPYVEFPDSNTLGVRVMKFNGTQWIELGKDVTNAYVRNSSFAVSSNGTPYVAYTTDDPANAVVLTKFNGKTWAQLSNNLPVQDGSRITFSLLLNSQNIPYIACQDNTNAISVSELDQKTQSWVPVGSNDFPMQTWMSLLGISSADIPTVAFLNVNQNNITVTVMQLNKNNAWVSIGDPNSSPQIHANGSAETSLTVDSSGNPYVFYSDNLFNGKLTVETLGN